MHDPCAVSSMGVCEFLDKQGGCRSCVPGKLRLVVLVCLHRLPLLLPVHLFTLLQIEGDFDGPILATLGLVLVIEQAAWYDQLFHSEKC